jgi:hypothetical protein
VERSAGNVFLEPGRPESWYVQERFTFVTAHPRQTAVLHEKQRSCGCATCEIVPATVAPGDAAQIALRFGVPYLRGQRREWALIGTDLDTYPQFLVSVSASIYPRLDVRVLAADNAQAGQQLAREAPWDTSVGLARKGQVVMTTDHPRQPRIVLPVYVVYLGG